MTEPLGRLAVALATAWTVISLLSPLCAQQPAAQPLDWDADDSVNIAWLETHGRRLAGQQVVLWAPADLMSAVHQAALVDSLDRGVAELHRLIGSPLAWQRIGNRPIQYYLVADSIISHASGKDVVFISIYRALNGRAPYLHEATHELLSPPPPFYEDEYPDSAQAEAVFQAWPLWLTEGVPDVLAQQASSIAGVHEGDVFAIGGLAKVDSTCASRLTTNPWRADILRVIGGPGVVEALFTTDRRQVAPVFYACGQSMAKYVIELIGMEQTIALFPAIKNGDWTAMLERAAGMPLATLRARWQARLGLEGP